MLGMSDSSAGAAQMQYWGGRTLGAHHVHLIWWGQAKNFSSARNGFILRLFRDVAHSGVNRRNVYSILNEYTSDHLSQTNSPGVDSLLVPLPRVHSSACPRGRRICVSYAELSVLWGQVAAKKPNWQWDENNLYMILLPTGADACFGLSGQMKCSGAYWSGVHSAEWATLGNFPWAIVADDTDLSYTSFVFTHEHLEAITDPFPTVSSARSGISGWQDPISREVSDLCEGEAPATQTIGIHRYMVGQQWSNHSKRCVGWSAYHAPLQTRLHSLSRQKAQSIIMPFSSMSYLPSARVAQVIK